MRVIAAMSGGVDSSIAAALVRRAGNDVLGVYLHLRPQARDEPQILCAGPSHADDARRVAEAIGIPFRVLDLSGLFEQEIVEPFARSYLAGETPNPCVRCNALVKFGALMEWGVREGFDHVATGHYAQAAFDESVGRWRLMRARFRAKDQSYFLSRLSQQQLARCIFPLGEMVGKDEVRAMARAWGLPVAEKAESQDACVAEGDYRQFLIRRLGDKGLGEPGPILNARGEVLGRHSGIANYTIGQRRGLGFSHPRPLFVIRIDPAANAIVVGEESETFARRLVVDAINWISIPPPTRPLRALVQIRYQHPGAPAEILPQGADRAEIVFDAPQRSLTPGQAAVFYEGEAALGGGWIVEGDEIRPMA